VNGGFENYFVAVFFCGITEGFAEYLDQHPLFGISDQIIKIFPDQ